MRREGKLIKNLFERIKLIQSEKGLFKEIFDVKVITHVVAEVSVKKG
jgi:hypothetical protein